MFPHTIFHDEASNGPKDTADKEQETERTLYRQGALSLLGRPGGPLGAFGGVGGVGPCGLCFGPLKSGGFNPPGSGCPPGWGWVALGVALWRPVGSLGSFVASVLGL